MPVAYFQIPLSVRPTTGGDAVLVPPTALQGLNMRFVIVREGAGEGIVRIEGPAAVLKQIGQEKNCSKLTARQMEAARKGYAPPKQKRKLRTRFFAAEPHELGGEGESPEIDEKRSRLVDTYQTVRSGIYLIDVPVFSEEDEK